MKKLALVVSVLILCAPFVYAIERVSMAHVEINVAATSTTVSTNTRRSLLIMQNKSDEPISCKFDGSAAVVGEGFIFNPYQTLGHSGTSLGLDVAIPNGIINCIHGGTGNKVMGISEG